jgi:dihydroxy-acid dehydratase
MAGRCDVELSLDEFDRLSRCTPVLANIRPSGEYLMEDFYYAGGLPALMAQIKDLLHLERVTVSGRTLGENLADAVVHDERVIRPRENPLSEHGGLAILRGNLAPDGAVIKHLAASPHLLCHSGPALVFEDYRDMQTRVNDPELDVSADSVLVLRHAGPQGGPGMPEYGMLPIPDKLLREGVRDMVRISDARMSGTSYGTCVLHVAPESFVGGPLALVQDGDLITLDVAERRLHLEVTDDELRVRKQAWTPPEKIFERGYGALYSEHIGQADQGCDFDFLARTGAAVEPDAR